MTELSDKMRALAKSQTATVASDLVRLADEFDAKTDAMYAPTGTREDTKACIGAWARARKLYCSVTGEPLVPGLF